MKKLFTKARYLLALVSLVLLGTNVAVAQNTYELYNFEGATLVNTGNFFQYSTSNFWKASDGYTFDANGTSCSGALKMEGNTEVTFKTSAKSTVYIGIAKKKSGVDYAPEDNRSVNFDDKKITMSAELELSKGEVFEILEVQSGSHTIKRTSKEVGLFYIKVVEEESSAVELDAPKIELNQATGQVTITPAENAISTAYTIDGTTPSNEIGEQISEVTTIEVNDGTVIKAISLGDNENYISSDVVEKTMLRTGITIATPEIKSFNGTFVITCASLNAKIEYSYDNSEFVEYERAITLTEAKTVYARASRDDCTDSKASAEVDVLPSVNGANTVYLSWGDFDNTNGTSTTHGILKGKEGNDAYGWTIELTGAFDKSYSSGSSSSQLATPKGNLSSIKLSNGAANTLTIPEGKAVTKLTFYSMINAAGPARTSGWDKVGEESYKVGDLPMGAYTNATDCWGTPDVRSYEFDNATGTIEFKNTGEQLCFVIAVEYVDILNVEITDEEGYATFSSAYNVAVPDGVTAYGTEKTENNTINLVEITDGVIPANTGVILIGEKDGDYTFKATTETAEVKTVLTANLEDEKTLSEGDYVLGRGTNGIGFYHLNSESTLGANKAYIAAKDVAGARVAFIGFDDNTVTAIDAVAAPATAGKAYNLNGVQAAPNAKGVVIMDGKKVVIK